MLIVPSGVVIDVDSVSVGHGVIRQRVHHDPDVPVKLLVTASGSLRHGNLVSSAALAPAPAAASGTGYSAAGHDSRGATVSLSACTYSQ